jgi:hypothetical protein
VCIVLESAYLFKYPLPLFFETYRYSPCSLYRDIEGNMLFQAEMVFEVCVVLYLFGNDVECVSSDT